MMQRIDAKPLRMRYISLIIVLFLSCSTDPDSIRPRLTMFVGVDISGSFMKSENFDESLDFLAHYLYAHLNGLGGLERPNALFVGSIGDSPQLRLRGPSPQ